MTVLTGDLQSISGAKFGGPGCAVLIYSRITRIGFATDAMILELVDRIPMPTEKAGKFTSPVMDPGPIRVELEGREVHGQGWDIDLPESGTWSLANLIDAQVEWSPAVVGRAEMAATEAAQAAVRAESAVVLLESALAAAADSVRVEVASDADRAVQAREGAETARAGAETAQAGAETARSEAQAAATTAADGVRTEVSDLTASAQSAATAAAGSASDAASSATSAATHEDTSLDASAAAIAAAWSFDGFTPAQVADAALRAEAAAVRAEAPGGGIIVVSSEEEAAALPIGTVYVIAPGEPGTPEPEPVSIVGSVGENITTTTFTPTIPNATTGDTIIIAANTKAVSGSTLTAPAGFTTLVDGYWKGTQQSWVLTGPWSDDLTVTADQPLEFAYAAVAVRGATAVTAGMVKDRTVEPTESTTVTAPAVERGTNDLAIGIAFERTSATETPEQVTVNEGWTIEHYTAQGANFQTTLIGVGGTGDMVATYPNAQATNGAGVQVVAHA